MMPFSLSKVDCSLLYWAELSISTFVSNQFRKSSSFLVLKVTSFSSWDRRSSYICLSIEEAISEFFFIRYSAEVFSSPRPIRLSSWASRACFNCWRNYPSLAWTCCVTYAISWVCSWVIVSRRNLSSPTCCLSSLSSASISAMLSVYLIGSIYAAPTPNSPAVI